MHIVIKCYQFIHKHNFDPKQLQLYQKISFLLEEYQFLVENDQFSKFADQTKSATDKFIN